MPAKASPARAPLTRARILQAALDLADERGLNAVTMRAVAERLGVTPMALYAHVRDKEGLLDGLVERVLDEVPTPDLSLPWQKRLEALARTVNDVANSHPQAFPLLLTRPAATRGAVRVREIVYAALFDAGVPDLEVPRVERLVSTIALGYAISQSTSRFGSRLPWEASEELSEEEFPAHIRLSRTAAKGYEAHEFHEAMESMVMLVAAAGDKKSP
jgi:AcrR family transcriptional regulator